MNGFDALRKRITKIADEVLAIDGAYPTWDYADLMQLIDAVEEERKEYDSLCMTINYLCPKCNGIMMAISTTSIPPIKYYQCRSCGYKSKFDNTLYYLEPLPQELQWEDEESENES